MKQTTNYIPQTSELRDCAYLPEFGLHATGPPTHLGGPMLNPSQPFLYSGGSMMNGSATHNGVLLMNGTIGGSMDPYSNSSVLLPLDRVCLQQDSSDDSAERNQSSHLSMSDSAFMQPLNQMPVCNLQSQSHHSSSNNCSMNESVNNSIAGLSTSSSNYSLSPTGSAASGRKGNTGHNHSHHHNSSNNSNNNNNNHHNGSSYCSSAGSNSSSSSISFEYYQANVPTTTNGSDPSNEDRNADRSSSPSPYSGDNDSVKCEQQMDIQEKYGCMFSESDIALATEPGANCHFDPSACHFSDEELRPQPMLRKSRKQAVPECQKDIKYWARRAKNNMAAKKSREQRRLKENQVLLRASFLERQNHALRVELQLLRCENAKLVHYSSQ